MSKAIQIFNGLNGAVVERETLQRIISIAKEEEQLPIVTKLENLLATNPERSFEIDLRENAIEIVPTSILSGLNFDDINEEDQDGLGKPVSPNEIYQSITDLILNTIKEVGHLPWHKEWKGSGLPTARNYVTEQPYTGVNAYTLPYELVEVNGKMTLAEPKTSDVYFLTFNQIESLGAKLKKGSKSRHVVYFNFIINYSDNENPAISIKTSNANDFGKFVKKYKISKEKLDKNTMRFPILKYYNVFKADDCENLPKKQPKKVDAKPIDIAEKVIELYPNRPKIVLGADERAYYTMGEDAVYMPKMNAFNNESYYYSTFFHELVHSTGYVDRLNRLVLTFGKDDPNYAFEELVAELGAVYLCAETGILFNTIENSAKYLRGWNRKLIGKLEEDNKFFFKAAAAAQKASNFILNLDEKGIPAYRLFFEKQAIEAEKKREEKKVATKKESSRKGNNEVVGYLLLDSISGELVASKKTLPQLKTVFESLEFNDDTNDLEVFVYEIINKKGNNVQGNRVNVDWEKPIKVEIAQTSKKPTNKTVETSTKSKEVTKPVEKIDENGQYGLFGKKEKLNGVPATVEPEIKRVVANGSKAISIRDIGQTESEFFTVNGEVGKFLQAVEKKPFKSVVITMDGEQGAGKTTTLYKFIDAFASAGNPSLFLSFEEHPESSLAIEKRNKFLSEEALNNTAILGEVANVDELYKEIEHFDIIFIDSWQKLLRMVGTICLDEDLRQKFDGKVFVVIFQQTTTGRTKGGSEVVFDGDIIIKMVKEKSFEDNYAYFDKNRYTKVPIETIRYNIATGTVYNPQQIEAQEEEQEQPGEVSPGSFENYEPIELSFDVN